jgi:hypothetical protein
MQSTWAIKVKELTQWHKLLGTYYIGSHQPVILVTPDLENRFELLQIVEEHLKEYVQ